MIQYASCATSRRKLPHTYAKIAPFTAVVWTQLSSWLNLSHLPPIDSATTIYGWWTKCRARVQKEFCRTLDGVLIYFWWNIWKECNRPTFNNDFKQAIDAAYLIKDGILQFATAHLGSAFTTTDS